MNKEDLKNAALLGVIIIYSAIMFCLGVIVGFILLTA